jgi:inosine/xanthosine triphosphatase
MKIAIGSKNPVKIQVTKNVIKKVWPDAKVVSVDVKSGVKTQPLSNDEAIKGAINRAKKALKKLKTDLGIGMEGSVHKDRYGTFLSGWTAVVDKNGKTSIGCGGRIILTEKFCKELNQGKEIGEIIDKLTGKENTKQKMGAMEDRIYFFWWLSLI